MIIIVIVGNLQLSSFNSFVFGFRSKRTNPKGLSPKLHGQSAISIKQGRYLVSFLLRLYCQDQIQPLNPYSIRQHISIPIAIKINEPMNQSVNAEPRSKASLTQPRSCQISTIWQHGTIYDHRKSVTRLFSGVGRNYRFPHLLNFESGQWPRFSG